MNRLNISFDVLIKAPVGMGFYSSGVLEKYTDIMHSYVGVFGNKRCKIPHEHQWLRAGKNNEFIARIFE